MCHEVVQSLGRGESHHGLVARFENSGYQHTTHTHLMMTMTRGDNDDDDDDEIGGYEKSWVVRKDGL